MNREEAGVLLQAYLDGELDPAKSVELEAHLAADPASRAACERLRSLSGAIREKADYHRAPETLSARLRAGLPAAPAPEPVRRRWPALAAALASTAAVSVALTLALIHPGDDRIEAFEWPERADERLRMSVRDGFQVARFARDGMRYWLVSDLNRAELADLAQLLGAH
jgi:anti-sigma factor RsiW